MLVSPFTLREDYWNTFELQEDDVEFLYNYLLEKEIPLTSRELAGALVEERVSREKINLEKQRSAQGDIYIPSGTYTENQQLVFPAFSWQKGTVVGIREGNNPQEGKFDVIKVKLQNGSVCEFASRLENHILNQPVDYSSEDKSLDPSFVMAEYGEDLVYALEEDLETNPTFVRIAGRWFPRALLVDVNVGHLNLAEAVLDMAGGGPMKTQQLMEQIELPTVGNPKLAEFSLDLALQEDPRFDEVGPTGEVLWYLHRLEPEEVKETPSWLRYSEIEYDRSLLTPPMLALERELDDELSPISGKYDINEAEIVLIYPHLRAGTLPLSTRIRHLFPSAYESPRIRFNLVDGETGEEFEGWVVRKSRYVYGLKDWYEKHNLIPGSRIWVRRGSKPGEVIVRADQRRPSREWIRTLLIGSDAGVVFAMLKQVISAGYDDRMAIVVPDTDALDLAWQKVQKDKVPFERTVVNIVRELSKLNPQSHVHASELYAAVNLIRRCPPGPILALLASRSWFVHVGDLHFRFDDSEQG